MKLWLISQKEKNGYDTYSDAVVAASSLEEARLIHPEGKEGWNPDSFSSGSWASSPKNVSVIYLGEADTSIEAGLILASFHAG